MKSALLKIFRAAFAALLLLSCASGGVGQSGKPVVPLPSRPILNLRLVASAGPGLADGVTLIGPAAVTANGIGDLFISDKAANTIYKLSSTLELISTEGGPSSSEFVRPQGLACDAALNVYVADNGNKRIQILDRSLRLARSVTSYFDQNQTSVDFNLPSDIAIDGEGNIWVADDNIVVKLDPFFNLLLEISDKPPSPFILGKVASVKTTIGGLVAIADQGNSRIAIISTAGNYIGQIPVTSPQAAAWDSEGNIWVIESGKLSAYDINGNLRYSFSGDNPGSRPVWVTFDSSDRLILLDGGLRSINVYEVIKGAAPAGER